MEFRNGKGAAVATNDAQGKMTEEIIHDRKLVRQVRRKLRKAGYYTLRLIDGRYFVVGVHPWGAITDMRQLADSLGLHACEFCGSHARTSDIDGMFACVKCTKVLRADDADRKQRWRFKRLGTGWAIVSPERRAV